MGADSSQVKHLAIDLHRAPERMSRDMRRVVKKTALEVKRGMQSDFSGHNYAGAVPGSFEMDESGSNSVMAQARIGELDSAGPQWGIAAILAYGTSNNAPVVDHTNALHREVPVMIHHLTEAAENDVLG